MYKILNAIGNLPVHIPPTFRKALGQIIGAQMIFQVMGLAISLILVRILPKSEYAIYTVLMAVLGMLSIISNSGIMIGFKKVGAEVWDKPLEFFALIKTTLAIRKYLILFSFLIVGSYSVIVFYRQETPLHDTVYFLIALFLMVVPNSNIGILTEALLLQKKIVSVQWQLIINQALRFVLILLIYFFFTKFLNIKTVLAITVIAIWISYLYLKINESSLVKNPVNHSLQLSHIENTHKHTLIKYIKINWHNSVFYAFKDQIAILIMGFYGTTSNLADLGAITRFTMIFLFIQALTNNLLGPSFGKCRERQKLIKMARVTLGAYFILCVLIILIAIIFSDNLLSLLGSKYSNLKLELVMVFVLGLVMLGVHILNLLNNSKGWIRWSPILEIPTGIAGIVFGVLFFDVSTPLGALYLSIFSFVLMLGLYGLNFYYGLFKSFEN